MAVRFDAGADYLIRTTDLPASNPLTVSLWFYIAVDRNSTGVVFVTDDASEAVFQGVFLSSDGTTLLVATNLGQTAGTNLTVGAWNHLGYIRNGTSHILYLNGVQDASLTSNNSFTPARFYIGSNGTNFVNARVSRIKIWTTNLSVAELNQERWSVVPKRTADLYGWWPTFTGASERLADYSGNGRNWTANGTLTDEDPPPVSWGAGSLFVPYAVGGQNASIDTADIAIAAYDGVAHQIVGVNAAAVTLAAHDVTAQPGAINAGLDTADVAIAALTPTTRHEQSVGATDVSLAAHNPDRTPGSVTHAINTADVTLAAQDAQAHYIQAVGTAAITVAGQDVTASPGAINASLDAADITLTANDLTFFYTQPVGTSDIAVTAYDAARTPGDINAAVNTTDVDLAAYDASASLGGTVAEVDTCDVAVAAYAVDRTVGSINAVINTADVAVAAYAVDRTVGSINAAVNAADVLLVSDAVGAHYTQPLTAADCTLTAYALGAGYVQAVDTAGVSVAAYDLSTNYIQAISAADVDLTAYAPSTTQGAINAGVGAGNFTFAAYNADLPPTPDERVFTIPADNRTFTIPADNRTFVVPAD